MNGKNISPINEALRHERLLRGWSQKDVADRLGITIVTVNRWERGIQQPGPIFRLKLCALFGKNEAELGLLAVEEEAHDSTVTSASLSTPVASQEHVARVSITRLFPHRLRRYIYIFLFLIFVSLVIVVSLDASQLFTTTPSAQKTIATFCQALVDKDFQTAYNQFSSRLQQHVPISELMKSYSVCTTAPSPVSDAHPQCTLRVTTEANKKYWRLISLSLDEHHTWKINSWGVSHKG